MRSTTDKFKVNGVPLLAPDEDVTVNYEDLDSSDSGRDESGVMHRAPLRYKVGSWGFTYSHLTEEERTYMESLFPNAPEFDFEHPDRLDSSKQVTSRAYRTKYGIAWKNASTGLWSNYSFNIIEC